MNQTRKVLAPMEIDRKDYLTPNEAARRMGVSGQTVRRWIDRGLIPSVRLPSGRHLIHKDHAVAVPGRPSN